MHYCLDLLMVIEVIGVISGYKWLSDVMGELVVRSGYDIDALLFGSMGGYKW